jgi:hypothetical protein
MKQLKATLEKKKELLAGQGDLRGSGRFGDLQGAAALYRRGATSVSHARRA